MAAAKQRQEPAPEPTPTPEAVPTTSLSTPPIVRGDLWTSREALQLAKEVVQLWASASLIPQAYQQNPGNCLIIYEMAARLNMSPLMLMNVIDVIRGRPAWRSQFIIATVNTCGKFKSPGMMWKFSGEPNTLTRGCYAYAVERHSGEVVAGDTITIQQAKAEGWVDRDGSKWRTLPELMLRYRAGAFFGRMYVPEKLLGLYSVEEMHDIIDVDPRTGEVVPTGVAGAKELLAG